LPRERKSEVEGEAFMKMNVTLTTPDNLAELLTQLGDIPLERIRLHPPPGTATERDVEAALETEDKRLCELVDGVLVEKPVGTREGFLAVQIVYKLCLFLETNKLGRVFGADAAMRLMPGLVRIPDVSFVSRERLRGSGWKEKRIADLVPDLAIEVLSESNTRGEIQRKLRDYFLSGVRLVWLIRLDNRTAEAYQAPDRKKRIGKRGTLEGCDVLPGFSLTLPELFAEFDSED
jgi:Uma2 family endonuclease